MRYLAALAVMVAATVNPWPATAHLAYQQKADRTLTQQLRVQERNLAHARYVCANGAGKHKRWACQATVWIEREWQQTMNRLRPKTDPTVANMIAAAEAVKAASPGSDPWPNCPDPYDGGGYSWHDTKNCESPGYSWHVDPPGYYCGPLQLDPHIWASVIRRFGVPC